MSNKNLLYQFERGEIAEHSFHHADHVRLAFAYLSEYPALTALDNFTNALRRFAASRGKPDLYNETVTYAYLFIIRERMARSEGVRWEEFALQNADLLVWKGGILTRYYRESTLQSDLARRVFLLPDKFEGVARTPSQDDPSLDNKSLDVNRGRR
jgi:hypothetical protein